MYYFKMTILLVVYNFFLSIISMAVLLIDNSLWGLKLALAIVCLLIYLVLTFIMLSKEGEQGLTIRNSNDIEREHIIRTGEDRPLKIKEEYKTWKGFFIGFLACLPVVVCMIIHLITYFASAGAVSGAGVLAGYIYMVFFAPVTLFITQEVALWWQFLFILYSVPVMMLTCGAGYIFGAKKQQARYDELKQKHREIYGE